MNTIIINCCIDLYKASENKDGQRGDFKTLYERYGDELPYNSYYITESKLLNIVKEYLETVPETERLEFIERVLKLSPTSSYNSWKKS